MVNNLSFPAMPLAGWRPTKDTLHLYCQIIGKIRLALHPRLNHWWHVPLYVTPRGLSTHMIPYNSGSFEIEFDFRDHLLRMRNSKGREEEFSLYDGLTVADFYSSVFANLAKLGVDVKIRPLPYDVQSTIAFPDDTEHAVYEKEHVEMFHRILVWADDILEEFRGRFVGKSTPVHMFWHSFDLALTRFSGRRAPVREEANSVEREAYSHEVISFGFWFGDDNVGAPAFYSYTAPEPKGLDEEALSPPSAAWVASNGSHMAVLMYDDIREDEERDDRVSEFLESAYQAGAKKAGWDIKDLTAA